MKKLEGVVVPIVTPFDKNGLVDKKSLESLTDYIMGSGLNALYPCGTTGEMLLLDVEERKTVAETVINRTEGKYPVFVHVGDMTLKKTLELAKHAVSIGADGVGIVTPSFFGISEQGLIDYYTTIAHSLPEDFPVYLYAIPQNACNDITVNVADKVARECPNVIGIKYSYPDFTRIQDLMGVNGGNFSVLVGPDHLFEAVVAAGGDGTVSGNAMILKEHYCAIWKALQDGNFALAAKIQKRTNKMNSILCKSKNIAAYKYILKLQGIIECDDMRAPMEPLTNVEKEWTMKQLSDMRYQEVIL